MSLDYQTRIRKIVLMAAEAAREEMKTKAVVGIFESCDLFFKSCTSTEDGMLRLFPQSVSPPVGWKHAGAGRLNIDVPYDRYADWIHLRSTQLPLLAPEY
ncbi:hypothetical protein LPN04_31270 [Rugamonas sp. A1-17]|nr:hypothetical protein [Rugamonas sp. A1-17]